MDEREGKDDDDDELDDDVYYANLDLDDSRTLNNETFPCRLYRMLYEVEKNGQEDIVSFCRHGKVVCIHRSEQFVKVSLYIQEPWSML